MNLPGQFTPPVLQTDLIKFFFQSGILRLYLSQFILNWLAAVRNIFRMLFSPLITGFPRYPRSLTNLGYVRIRGKSLLPE